MSKKMMMCSALPLMLAAAACDSAQTAPPTVNGSGGASVTGGAQPSGGTTATGGTTQSGGSIATGGISETGGIPGSGGVVASGGAAASGGSDHTGGTAASGGVVASGGAAASGGVSDSGGSGASNACLGDYENPSGAIIRFEANGQCTLVFGSESEACTYAVDGDTVTLTSAGNAIDGTFSTDCSTVTYQELTWTR